MPPSRRAESGLARRTGAIRVARAPPGAGDRRGGAPRAAGGGDPRRLARGLTTVAKGILVVGPDEPLREAFVDESQREAVRQALTVGQATVRARQAGKGVRLDRRDLEGAP